MINTLLQDEEYVTLLKLRKHFYNASRVFISGNFGYDKPEYLNLIKIIEDIDAMILEKYKYDSTNYPNYNNSVAN